MVRSYEDRVRMFNEIVKQTRGYGLNEQRPENHIQYFTGGKAPTRKSSNEGGSYDWLGDLTRDLPTSMGSTQAKRFATLAKQAGIPDDQLNAFRDWMDSRETGTQTYGEEIQRQHDVWRNKYDRNLKEKARVANNRLKAENELKAAAVQKDSEKKEKAKKNAMPFIKLLAKGGKAVGNVGETLSEIDKSFNKKVEGSKVDRFMHQSFNSIGVDSNRNMIESLIKEGPKAGREEAYNKMVQEYEQRYGGDPTALDFLASLTGYAVPASAAYKVTKAAGAGANTVGKSILGKIGQYTKEGAVAGGILGGAEVALREGINPDEYSAVDNLKHLGLNVGLGAALDPAIMMAGPLAKQFAKSSVDKGKENVLKQLLESGDFTGSYSPDLDPATLGGQGVPEPQALRILRGQESVTDLSPTVPKVNDGKLEPLALEEPEPFSDEFIDQLIANRRARGSEPPQEPPLALMEQPSEAPSMDKLFKKAEKPRSTPKDVWDRFRKSLDSDLDPLKQIDKEMLALDVDGKLDRWISPDNKEYLTVGSSLHKGTMEMQKSVARGIESADRSYRPIIQSLRKAKISNAEFDKYAAAVHYRDIINDNMDLVARRSEVELKLEEIEAQRIEKGDISGELERLERELLVEYEKLEPYAINKNVTEEEIASIIQKYENNPAMQDAHKRFIREQQKDLHMRAESGTGLYSKAEIEAMIEKHPNYISLKWAEPEGPKGTGGRNPSTARRTLGRRGTGSEEGQLNPVLASAYQRRIQTHADISKAKAMNTLSKYVEVEGAEKFFRQVSEKDPHFSKMTTVHSFKDGKKVYYEVPETVATIFQNLDNRMQEEFGLGFVRGMTNLYKKGTTHLNVPFHFIAATRDSINAIGNSRTGATLADTVLGFVDSFVGPQLTKATGGKFKSYKADYKAQGGEMAGFISGDQYSMQQLTEAMRKGTLGKGNEVLNPFKAVERFGMAMEHGPRLGEYRSAKRKGLSDADASFEATDIINYADMGSLTRKINPYDPYLGAIMRGNIRTLQGMKENPKRFLETGMAYVTLPTLAVIALQNSEYTNDVQRDKIRNLKSWQKNTFWAIPVPGTDKLAFMPKPFIFGQIFANPVERHFSSELEGSKRTAGEFLKETGLDMFSTFAPPVTITLLTEGWEQVANQDFFTGMPIESSEMQKQENKADRHDSYTSEISKILGSLTGQSPARIDHALKKTTGTLGRDALDITDRIIGDTPKVTPVTQTLDPFKRFKHDDTSSSGVYSQVYEQKRKDDNAGRTGTYAQKMYEQMQPINKEIQAIREDTKMTTSEKNEKIAKLRDKQRALGSEYLKNFRQADVFNKLLPSKEEREKQKNIHKAREKAGLPK